jgi:hypothetical protein
MTKMNLFQTAQVVDTKKASKKKSDKVEVNMQGLEDYATVVSLMKNLEGIKSTLEGEIKSEMKSYFTKNNNGSRPENFRGIEGNASASCEMRKRTATSALSETEISDLTADNIPVEKAVSTPERFVINPDFMNDQALLEKVSKALLSIKGLPENFIMMQPEVSKTVVSDETLDMICQKGLLSKYFDAVTTMAIKPKLDKEMDIAKVISAAKTLLIGA